MVLETVIEDQRDEEVTGQGHSISVLEVVKVEEMHKLVSGSDDFEVFVVPENEMADFEDDIE